jgi:hypothetical protein
VAQLISFAGGEMLGKISLTPGFSPVMSGTKRCVKPF